MLRTYASVDHQRLHEQSHFTGLLDGTLGLDTYRDLMCRLYGLYVPLDRAIFRALDETDRNGDGFGYSGRSEKLARDMAGLGFSDAEIAAAPRCAGASDVVSQETLGGVLYVVEGSTLGGTHLDRVAQRILGAEVETGRGFWMWCRSENKRRWSMTNQYLEQLVREGTAMESIGQGARDTFRLIADWMAPLDRRWHAGRM